jgi:probable HAF family extracellular repeat protein
MSMRASLGIIALSGACGTAAAQTGFQALGPLGQPFGVNDDGQMIVGRTPSSSPGAFDEACRWSGAAPAPAGLGFIAGTDDSVAFATSGNGSVVVGASGESTYDYGLAFRWADGQMQSLGLLGGGVEYSMANSVSRDGSVIVGEGDTPFFYTMAWRKVGSGPLQEIGPFPGGTECWALDVSADGSVITGGGFDSTDAVRAFRWTQNTGMVPLPLPAGSIESQAFGISPDGQHIAGAAYLSSSDFEVPCLWNGTTPTLLPVPATHTGGVVYAVSNAGSVAVGNLWLEGGLPEAMIWTSAAGTRRLDQHLVAGGAVIPGGWRFTHAWDVSPDGRIVIGTAVDAEGVTQAFAATLFGPPLHSGCSSSDFDGDGDSGTDADIEAFFRCLAGNCCSTCWVLGADFNGDGDTGTDADIESFFRVLAGGNC